MYIGIKIPGHHLHHVTLAFLGKSVHDNLEQYKRAAAAVSAAAVPFRHENMLLNFGGTDQFQDGPWYTPVWSLELLEYRETLVECMQYYAVDFANDYEYTPHVTLSYWPKKPANPYEWSDMTVKQVSLVSNELGTTDFWI